MQILSRPRPNGSEALEETRRSLVGWLEFRGIPYKLQNFDLYPFFFESLGIWFILSRLLLAISIWQRWGWITLVIAVLGLVGGTLDAALYIPLITWPGKRTGQNILVTFEPDSPLREVILTAHYDSKTELLDHHQRMFFLRKIPTGVILSLLLGLLGPLDYLLVSVGSPWAAYTYALGITFSFFLLFLAGGYGINLVVGRFLQPSQGSVDNGAACAILLKLAERINQGKIILPEHTRLTLALFGGEEVDRQGSRAYVNSRTFDIPCSVLNLEVMAQDGEYVVWEQDGSVFKLMPTTWGTCCAVRDAVLEVSGSPACNGGPITSDGASFLKAGLPTSILGTYDRRLKDTGFHRPSDNLARVKYDRLDEGVRILEKFIHNCSNPIET
jgi:hypothetical protein